MWHEKTRKWRESGKLIVLGIVQEQHPDRARLFAQWQGIDWPLLWDPFNTTGAKVVPNFTLIDEHGIVRSRRPRLDTIEAEFLDVAFPKPKDARTAPEVEKRERLARLDDPSLEEGERSFLDALSAALWTKEQTPELARTVTDAYQRQFPPDGKPPPSATFQFGVWRMLSTEQWGPTSLSAAAFWKDALDQRTDQYIWRRRLQQYGPRLDKPYPFYDWVERARAEVTARGETPVALAASLTASELGGPARAFRPAGEAAHPDPKLELPRDESTWLYVQADAVADTQGRNVARVYVFTWPKKGYHWNNEGEPPRLWVEVPKGYETDARLVTWKGKTDGPTSDDVRRFEFEIRMPEASLGAEERDRVKLSLLVFFDGCRDEDGICMRLRRHSQVELSGLR